MVAEISETHTNSWSDFKKRNCCDTIFQLGLANLETYSIGNLTADLAIRRWFPILIVSTRHQNGCEQGTCIAELRRLKRGRPSLPHGKEPARSTGLKYKRDVQRQRTRWRGEFNRFIIRLHQGDFSGSKRSLVMRVR